MAYNCLVTDVPFLGDIIVSHVSALVSSLTSFFRYRLTSTKSIEILRTNTIKTFYADSAS